MRVLHVIWTIIIGIAIGFIALISAPLLLLYVGVKIIGGMASKI